MSVLILVVDDEEDVELLFRQRFRHDLKAGRFLMEFVQSASAALQRIANVGSASLILIFSDINMPGMSGLELLPKARAARPDVPVIMITAYGDQLVWERLRQDSDGGTSVEERNRFSICVVDLDSSLPYFHGIYLHPRRGLFAPYSDWLGRTPVRSVEVESSQFVERYELRAASDQDDLLLRRLLSPSVVSWLANHPLAPGFELKAGTLCLFVPHPLEDAGNLTYLIDAARYLAGRVAGEVGEEMARPA